MRSLFAPRAAGEFAPIHLIVLPGAYQTAAQCLESGLLAAVRQRGLAADVSGVDLELEHLTDRATVLRLGEEVIGPARERGARRIWLVGISLGGYAALDYVSRRGGDVDGLCLLAPFLGSRAVAAEIASAGGLGAWSPGALAADDEERRIWAFIRACQGDGGSRGGAGRPHLYLGAGDRDRFAHAHALLAPVLPAASVDLVPGGHDWRTWLTLWERFLDKDCL
jgi:pimeloyl-ACP methyl ester carboxylesterase